MLDDEFYQLARFHHIGLAVKDFQDAVAFWGNIGYFCTSPIRDDMQNVELIMCTSKYFPSVELIKPVNERSPIVNYLKNYNEIIYHICFEVDSLKRVLEIIKRSNKIICAMKAKDAVLFNNRLVSFYYIKDVGLFEFLEK